MVWSGTCRALAHGSRLLFIGRVPAAALNPCGRTIGLENGGLRFKAPISESDVIVSCQASEHKLQCELKPGRMDFLNAPSRDPGLCYPQDRWRFYPYGHRPLATPSRCDLLDVSIGRLPHPDPGSSDWGDTMEVFRKSPRHLSARLPRG